MAENDQSSTEGETGQAMGDRVITVIALPVTTPKGTAIVEIDVRSFGFLSVDELKRDPDWEKYVVAAVKAALKKPGSWD